MHQNFLIALLSILIFLSSIVWGDAGERLDPIDQTQEDHSFAQFKKKLMNAIQNKDVSFIKKILSDDVEYSFGTDPERKNAIDGFLNNYKIKNEKDSSSFWNELRQAIDLGCVKSEGSFTCPYVYSKWPDKYDSFSHVAVTKNKASIKAQPKASASEIKSVSYEILKLTLGQNNKNWYLIDLGKNKVGYLAKTDGRSATDYRAEFVKIEKQWMLKYFIAGD